MFGLDGLQKHRHMQTDPGLVHYCTAKKSPDLNDIYGIYLSFRRRRRRSRRCSSKPSLLAQI